MTASGHGRGRCPPLSACGFGRVAGEPGVSGGVMRGRFFVPHPSVISGMWLQCLLSLGECCFLISAC